MFAGTSRRFAAPLVVACVGMLGSAATAHAAGGLSVTPAILEHRANLGKVGSFTLTNTTNETLQVTINVRPWMQQLDGKVFTDPRATFNRYVRAELSQVHDARRRQAPDQPADGPPHRERLALRQHRHPRQADQYQGPQGDHPQLPPGQLAAPDAEGAARSRSAPARRRSAAARSCSRCATSATRSTRSAAASASPARPRATATSRRSASSRASSSTLALTGTSGLKKGRYTINATVTQAGRNVNARTSFTIR